MTSKIFQLGLDKLMGGDTAANNMDWDAQTAQVKAILVKKSGATSFSAAAAWSTWDFVNDLPTTYAAKGLSTDAKNIGTGGARTISTTTNTRLRLLGSESSITFTQVAAGSIEGIVLAKFSIDTAQSPILGFMELTGNPVNHSALGDFKVTFTSKRCITFSWS